MSEATTTRDPWAEDEEQTPETAEAKSATKPDGDAAGADAPAQGGETAKAATKPAKKTPAAKPGPKPEAPKPTAASNGSLGAVLGDMTTYVTGLLWGPEGTGKTTSALRMTQIPEAIDRGLKVMLIDAEGGAKVRALKAQGVDVTRVEVWPRPEDGGPGALTFEGLYDLADRLGDRADEFIGWTWDSGSEITKRLLDQVTADARAKDQRLGKERGRFQINLEDHGVASSMLRELLRKYRDLPMHGVITALERRDTDNDTGRVKYGPAMAPAMANDAAGLVDIVMFMEIEEVSGTPVRTGKTMPTRIRRAKDRFGVLPPKMPDPYMDRIVAYVNGDLVPDNDPVRARIRELAQAAAGAAENKEK